MKVNIVELLQSRRKTIEGAENEKIGKIYKSPAIELVDLKGCCINQAYQQAGLLEISQKKPEGDGVVLLFQEGVNFIVAEFVDVVVEINPPPREAMIEHAEGSAYGNAN